MLRGLPHVLECRCAGGISPHWILRSTLSTNRVILIPSRICVLLNSVYYVKTLQSIWFVDQLLNVDGFGSKLGPSMFRIVCVYISVKNVYDMCIYISTFLCINT